MAQRTQDLFLFLFCSCMSELVFTDQSLFPGVNCGDSSGQNRKGKAGKKAALSSLNATNVNDVTTSGLSDSEFQVINSGSLHLILKAFLVLMMGQNVRVLDGLLTVFLTSSVSFTAG